MCVSLVIAIHVIPVPMIFTRATLCYRGLCRRKMSCCVAGLSASAELPACIYGQLLTLAVLLILLSILLCFLLSYKYINGDDDGFTVLW